MSTTKTLISLHRLLRKRSLKKSPQGWFLIILVWLYALPTTLALAFFTLDGLDTGNLEILSRGLCIGVVAYWALCASYPSSESQLTPTWFAPLPLTAHDLIPGFMLSALLQSRGLLVIINSLIMLGFGAYGLYEIGAYAAIAVWALGVIVTGCLTIVGGETIASLTYLAAGKSRRTKELVVLATSLLTIGGVLIFSLVTNTVGEVDYGSYDHILGYLPMGAGGGTAAAVAAGHYGIAVIRAISAVILIPLSLQLWRSNIARGMVTGTQPTSDSVTSKRSTVVLPLLPSNSFGALLSRQLLYSRRDIRVFVGLVTQPMAALCFVALSAVNDNMPWGLYAGALIAIGVTSWLANSIGYDGPANWLHMVAGVKPKELIGSKIVYSLILVVPLLAAVQIAVGLLDGFTSTWLVSTIVYTFLVISGVGVGVLLMVYNAYPVGKPGVNPYHDKSSYSSSAWITMLGTFFVGWIPLAPGIGLLVYWAQNNASAFLIGGIAWCAIASLTCALGGYWLAVRKLEKSWPELYDRLRVYV